MTDTGTGRQAAGTPVQAAGKAIGAGLLSTLALLMGLASFGIDLYLPAFPVMTTELSTTATGVQLSLTAFLIGAGAGQLVFGPWSDRAGRVVPLVFGAVLFVAASVTATLAGSIELLVAARLVQGLGGAAGMVIGRAIILDRARGTEAARALSIMMLIGGIAPIVAPVAGGALVGPVGWRGLLGIVTGLGVIALACVLVFVRESLPREIRRARAGTARRGGWRGLISRAYLGNTAAYAFGMAIMMAYISASPFVYQDMIGLSAAAYGIAFAINAVGLMIATTVAARLAGPVSLRGLTLTGLTISLAAVVAIVILTLTDAPAGWLMVPLFVAIAPLGLVFGNATALAMSAVPPAATGAGSALLGAVQFALAGLVAALVGIAGEHTAIPLGVTMLAAAIIALLGLLLATPRPRREPAA